MLTDFVQLKGKRHEMNRRKEKSETKTGKEEVDRRKFLEKAAKDLGVNGFALYEIARTIKTEIVQGVVDEVKNAIRKI